ncbi:response regulator [Planctomycetes bacterium CA13]|uniref:Response regulator n=2 Tax=Novipirellula herctigrandis TaxID=2527986 RepID=A0A5C5Z3I9_9BACT|nr:response regulator [Planctomycetes bacterium CA13]
MFEGLVEAFRKNCSLHGAIAHAVDSVYIKTVDNQILVTNTVYEQTFSGPVSSVGRFGEDFLNETIMPISSRSDALLLSGCSTVEFEHAGRDSQGRAMLLRTIKRSLLGSGHPRAAILGVTRIIEVKERPINEPQFVDLAVMWDRYSKLEEREQQVAVMVSKGESVKHMAKVLGVSDKTVENRRNAALKKLDVDSQAALIRLMVRLQDNGYCDVGL